MTAYERIVDWLRSDGRKAPERGQSARSLLARADVMEQMRRRAVQQALSEATAEYWERRAETFEWVAARPGDYRGPQYKPTEAKSTAEACRCMAAAIRLGWYDEVHAAEVDDFVRADLEEAA